MSNFDSPFKNTPFRFPFVPIVTVLGSMSALLTAIGAAL